MLPYINLPFEYVSAILGASTDELKLVFSFYLSYPLAGVLKRIPDREPWKKNVFIICVSLFYLVGIFDLWDGLQTLTISAVAAYIISWKIKSPFMPWIGFVFLMGHMSISHIYRQMVGDDSVVDITGAQMVMIMKLTAFCWNVQDGRLPDSELSEFQKSHAIRTLPDILDYAAYVLFFPALMAGPAFDYCDYSRYISTTMFALPPGIDPSKAPPTRKKRKIPRSGTPATLKAIQGSIWIFAFLKFSAWYNPSFFLGDEFIKYNFLRRVFQLYMLGLTTRMKYYGVWNLTEGACILSGIGYNGVDPTTGRAKWDRLTNIIPMDIELAQNSRAFVGSWNINTNLWLRNYMYLRVTPKGKKPGFRATLATFVTSAFWHGFYPGYYLTFVLAAFLQTVAKNTRRLVRPLFFTIPDPAHEKPAQALPSKKYYDIATFFITQAAFGFAVVPFVTLGFSSSIKVWGRVYFYDIIAIAAAFAVFSRSLPFRAHLVKMQESRVAASATTKEVIVDDKEGKKIVHDAIDEALGVSTNATSTAKTPSQRAPNLLHATDNTRHVIHKQSSEDLGPIFGVPDDPEKDVDEIIAEVKHEIEERKRRGSLAGLGTGIDVKKIVEERVQGLRKR